MFSRQVWSHILAVLAVTSLGVPAVSADGRAENSLHSVQPTFVVDHAVFNADDTNRCRLEIYYQIFNFGLQFVKDSGGYLAEYTLTAKVMDDDDDQVKAIEQEKSIRTQEYASTLSRFDYRTSQLNIVLEPGNYRVQITLGDRRSNTVFGDDFKVKLRRFASDLPITSDIEFVQAANSIDSGASTVFRKANVDVVPSVSRIFGGTDSSKLLFYVEIYRGRDSVPQVVMETIVRSLSKGMLYRDTLYVTLDGPVVRQLRDIAVGSFAPGDYQLETSLRGRRNKPLDEHTEAFTIAWTQEGLLKHDFKAAIEQLSYIAPNSEVSKIKKLETLEERIDAFNDFWVARDPTAGTPENEAKREFYRRVNYANRVFRYLRKDGWRTDRGRIYITYGDPDQIDDFPMSPNLPPYQIWHYYKEGRYKRFAFVDENDDGEYRLQYPYDGLNQRPDF
ncbi:MAG: GWxTD domain-containing protein [Candidatus Zixiibacteriota bacterium]